MNDAAPDPRRHARRAAPQAMTGAPSSRAALVAELRQQLVRDAFPRLTVTLILALSAGLAFLGSYVMLRAGVESMAVRYAAAALAGYVTFLLLIRGWTMVHGRGSAARVAEELAEVLPDADVGLPDVSRAIGRPGQGPQFFAAGRSGGGGGGGGWTGPVTPLRSHGRSTGGVGFDLDVDELWWVLVAVVAATGALVAVGFVVYSAPILLAEVALDAAIVAPIYRRLRREEAGHWAGAALRHTWIPALVVILFVGVAGFALQRAAPDARSIGGVWRALVDQ